MKRNLTVEGIYNVRDLGGYPTADGHATRWQVFVRAGNMNVLSPDGYQRLTDYGIKTLIDLRDESELEMSPNEWVQASDMTYRHLPLFGDHLSKSEAWQTENESHHHLHEHYAYYLDQCQAQIGAIMGAVVDSMPGTLFHCYMGKDRTGLIAGLVLGAVGVADEVIAEDYAQTTQHYADLVPEWRVRAEARGENLAHFDRDVASAPETMMETLKHLKVRYGGVKDYLGVCGVTEGQIGELRERFVEG